MRRYSNDFANRRQALSRSSALKSLALVTGVVCLFVLNARLSAQESKTVKVFILAGQSNMQGHAVVDLDDPKLYNGGKGTLEQLLSDPEKQERYSHLRTADYWTQRDDVFVTYKTESKQKVGRLSVGFTGYEGKHHFGPELQFGHVVGNFFEEPVLLIKTAWGGKSLSKDFRPPSAVKARGGEVGPYFRLMIDEIRTSLAQASKWIPELSNSKLELSGFVWQQGWNDMIDETARDEYFENLVSLIEDFRSEFDCPALPVVVGELGNGGREEVSLAMKHFRRQQSRIDAFEPLVGSVLFVPTASHARRKENSPNVTHLHHWYGNAESYFLVGDSLGKSMIKLIESDDLPRVLILGDSISIGYTPFVQEALASQSLVFRPMRNHFHAENCAGTKYGIQQIDRWLNIGGGNWDVIHFNFGLHDLKHIDPNTGKNSNSPDDAEQSPPDAYEKQLREIVAKLKATGAKLVFATTTPVPAGGVRPFRDPQMVAKYNSIARKIMEENDIAINDLNAIASARLPEIQRPVDVHFTKEGSKSLADQVATAITQELAAPAK